VDIVTSVTDELAANGYKVFPNPVQRSINVSALSSSLSKNPTIIIYDMGGKAVINTTIKSANKNIDLSSLQSGIYLMRIVEPQKSFSIKFIKD
jgi:hypothetical protein